MDRYAPTITRVAFNVRDDGDVAHLSTAFAARTKVTVAKVVPYAINVQDIALMSEAKSKKGNGSKNLTLF